VPAPFPQAVLITACGSAAAGPPSGSPCAWPRFAATSTAATASRGRTRDPEGAVVGLCRVGDSGAWVFDRAGRRYRPVFHSKTGKAPRTA